MCGDDLCSMNILLFGRTERRGKAATESIHVSPARIPSRLHTRQSRGISGVQSHTNRRLSEMRAISPCSDLHNQPSEPVDRLTKDIVRARASFRRTKDFRNSRRSADADCQLITEGESGFRSLGSAHKHRLSFVHLWLQVSTCDCCVRRALETLILRSRCHQVPRQRYPDVQDLVSALTSG